MKARKYAKGGGPTDPKKEKLTIEQKKAKREMNLAKAGELNKQIAEVDERLRGAARNRTYVGAGGKKKVRLGQSITKTKTEKAFNPGGKNEPLSGTAAKYSLGEVKDMLTAERDYALSRSAGGRRRIEVPIFEEGDTGGIAKEVKKKRLATLARPKSGTIRRQTPPMKS
jgi:hypothetical protein